MKIQKNFQEKWYQVVSQRCLPTAVNKLCSGIHGSGSGPTEKRLISPGPGIISKDRSQV